MNLETIIALATALAPYIQPAEKLAVALYDAVQALSGARGETDAQADADLQALIQQALADQAARQAAAAGSDPQ